MKLSAIYIYPVKSLPGILLDHALAEPRGLQHDRRWMLVDAWDKFISLRKESKLREFQLVVNRQGITVLFGSEELRLPWSFNGNSSTQVIVWNDQVTAAVGEEEWNQWFSRILGYSCRIVYMTSQSVRKVKEQWSSNGEEVSFADGYPYLIVGEGSRKQLSEECRTDLDIRRFRPNLVFTGGKPFEEFHFKHIRIGEAEFQCLKPCQRCMVITIDPDTGVQQKRTLAVLARHRVGDKVVFGQHASLHKAGVVRVGDELSVLSRKDSPYDPL